MCVVHTQVDKSNHTLLNTSIERHNNQFPAAVIELIQQIWDQNTIQIASAWSLQDPTNRKRTHAKHIQICTNAEVYTAAINDATIARKG